LFLLVLLSESSQSLGLGFSLFLLHGFLSTILFFLIGNFYHFFGTRLVFYFSGLFSLGLIFGVVWGAIVLGNSGVPPFMTFFSRVGGYYRCVWEVIFGWYCSFCISFFFLLLWCFFALSVLSRPSIIYREKWGGWSNY